MTTPIRLDMSMSLDGYVAGPDDRPGQELGRGGGWLFDWPLGGRRTELDLVRRLDDRDVTHLRYRVRR